MHRRLTKKVLSTIKDLRASAPESYATIWREFGRALKEGLLDDHENRDAILALCSFPSTHSAQEPTTLAQYVERMKEGQEEIFYLTGDSREAIENSPHMEAFRAKGVEVLLLTDPIDEVWVTAVPEFDGRQLRSITKGEVDLGSGEPDTDETEEERESRRREYSGLLTWMTEQLGQDIKEVRLSTRLTVSPACLVSDTHDITPALENIYRAMGQDIPHTKRILELNPGHSLVNGLNKAHTEREDGAEAGLADIAELLYGMALLAEGGALKDPARFTKLMADRLSF